MINICNPILIKTDRLSIRLLEMKDKDAFFAYRSLPEIYQFQGWRPKDKYEIEAFIAKNITACLNATNTWLQLAVCLKDGQLIGDIGIHFLEDDKWCDDCVYAILEDE